MNMKWFLFNMALLFCLLPIGEMRAQDTLSATGVMPLEEQPTKYDQRVHRYRKHWNALIPTQTVIQYAGNMGLLSAGAGWDYGKRGQWETHLLLGVLPKYQSDRTKMTMTLKENYIPWSISLPKNWQIEPLTCGLYFNTVFGSEFWSREPDRYPKDYYPLLKTKLRANIFVGQRITSIIPHNKRKFLKSLTAFYEVSTCDLYVRAMFQDKRVKLHDILGLSLGLKMQWF